MKTAFSVLFLLLMLLIGSGGACADRDIVYAARYYLPPGSAGTSHFHLYRINPDGTGRRQITFGNTDDSAPHWSPNGRWIVFTSLTSVPDGKDGSARYDGALCLLPAGGGKAKRLIDFGPDDWYEWGPPRWSPDSRTVAIDHQRALKAGTEFGVCLIDIRAPQVKHLSGVSEYSWSTDGKRALMLGAKGWAIQEMATGAEKTITRTLESAAWVTPTIVAGVHRDAKTELASVRFFDTEGRETRRLIPRFPAAYAGTGDDDPLNRPADLLPLPGRPQSLVYALNNHNSTVGTDYLFFTMQSDDGGLSYLTEGQFLAWSPDGTAFCTAPGRDTTPYEKRRLPLVGDYGLDRTVWYAPLFVRAATGGPMRQITPRLSWVVAADWRGGGRSVAGR